MKRLIALAFISAVALAGCWGQADNANTRDAAVVDKQQELYQKNQPLPFFNFSLPRDVYIQIYEAKNEARQTYSVVQSLTGQVTFECNSIGFPIPADTQLTNGTQISQRGFNNGTGNTNVDGVIGQPEPDGLYSSMNTDSTYILCVRDNGDVVPVSTELKVTTYPFPVTIDATGVAHDAGGPSTIQLQITNGSTGAAPSPSPSK